MTYDKAVFSERLVSLRMKKDVSARDMSLSIGRSENYVNKIEGRKSYPSMETFFHLCEYLDITPKEFFDMDTPNPARLGELVSELNALDDEDLDNILALVRRLRKQKNSHDG